MESTQLKEFRARIGRAMRKLREEEGISAQFLAKVLGVAQPTISRIENGTTSISAERLLLLATGFNRPLSFFIGGQSLLVVTEEDIVNAGLVFYGAAHLRSKRSINVLEYYRTYPSFLNVALKFSDNARVAAALGATIFKQATKDNLKPLQILSTVTNPRLQASLYKIAEITSSACPFVGNTNLPEAGRVRKRIRELKDELFKELGKLKEFNDAEHAAEEYSKIEITPQQIAQFIDNE